MLGEAHHPGLRRGVCGRGDTNGHSSGLAGDGHDSTPSTLNHTRQGRANSQKSRPQVNGLEPIPFVGRHIRDPTYLAHPSGGLHQNINGTEQVSSYLKKALHVGLLGDITECNGRLPARVHNVLHYLLAAFIWLIRRRQDSYPLPRQPLCGRGSDTSSASCYHGNLVQPLLAAAHLQLSAFTPTRLAL